MNDIELLLAYKHGRQYIQRHNSDLLQWYDSQEFVTVFVWDSVAWVSRDGMETHELIATSDVCEWLDQAFDDAEDDVARSIRWKKMTPSEHEDLDDEGWVQFYDGTIDD